MREIKFRGYDGGDWIYGMIIYYEKETKTWYMIENGAPDDWVMVDRVGQYTGLKDCNGREIYEGDIVKYIDASNTVNHLVVKWNESNACFDIGWVRTDYASNSGEVIGNIYNNPELLEK